jgi:hypothetical protein
LTTNEAMTDMGDFQEAALIQPVAKQVPGQSGREAGAVLRLGPAQRANVRAARSRWRRAADWANVAPLNDLDQDL